MKGEQAFELWAPPESPWSAWAKPVLFAQMDELRETPTSVGDRAVGWAPEPAATTYTPDPSAGYREPGMVPGAIERTAIVVEHAGVAAVATGLALARRGYRPVPLFNACHGPGALVAVAPIIQVLRQSAPQLAGLGLPPDAPPAFLVDAGRMSGTPHPGGFDNRSMVFPQDFPSATFLRDRGVSRVIVATDAPREPAADLCHVLLAWQKQGIEILSVHAGGAEPPARIVVKTPSRFGALAYRALAILGLKRSSAGGFGSVIPVPTQTGGYG